MPQSNKIDVFVYPSDDAIDEPLTFTDVNYISFVSSPGGADPGTYGIPAIVSETRYKDEGLPLKVLYVNPSNIAAMQAVRKA